MSSNTFFYVSLGKRQASIHSILDYFYPLEHNLTHPFP